MSVLRGAASASEGGEADQGATTCGKAREFWRPRFAAQ
ncbi:hypothetical protein JOC69_001416 [Heliobacterium gestii]|nr:hypothetical protein [Heliomicrobium gestii]